MGPGGRLTHPAGSPIHLTNSPPSRARYFRARSTRASLPGFTGGNTMKAAIFHAPHQPLTVEDVEIEKPKRREILLRTAYAGLCHSDLHFMEGLYPYPAPA